MTEALLLSFLAGAAIPIGGILAAMIHIKREWLDREFRHTVIAFGGGALVSAISLVLVPEGVEYLSIPAAAGSFLGGGIIFLLLDRYLTLRGGAGSQLMAMLLDFVPEAVALGSAFAMGSPAGVLLAFLIGIQNLPEGFNSYCELTMKAGVARRRALVTFALLTLLGPISAWIGMVYVVNHPTLLGILMLSSSGGILYLTFQDIAPQAKLECHWGPSLGAVVGFLLGLVGFLLTKGSAG
ncbi:MAG: divalent cation transporter [Acidobacteriota bacterium]